MCELLAMSANVPTDIVFSFTGLVERGGRTGPHVDGWGIAFYDGLGYRTFKDDTPSCESEIAKLIKTYPIKSKTVISHIRQANRGAVSLVNTHPFTRELWGQYWTYAHNGQLTDYEDKLSVEQYQAVGETDSELAFCWILQCLVERFGYTRPQNMKSVFSYIGELARDINQLGIFNFMITNGEFLLCFCSNNLSYITRRAPFGKATLLDTEMLVDFNKETSPNDVVTVIATRPLTTNEKWTILAEGEWCLFRFGELCFCG